MGKRQHQKDKLYLTATEYAYFYGGRPAEADLHRDQIARFRKLPFNYCCLSLQPFDYPCCNEKGYVFDIRNIVKFLKKYKKDPIDGSPTEAKNIVKLNFYKNDEGKFQCPVMYKDFNEHSHIVAIRTSGNVFSHEAIDQLCLKRQNFRDPLNDEPFVKKDLIIIQDPEDLEKQNASLFYHFVNKLKWAEDEEKSKDDSKSTLNKMDYATKSTLDELTKSNKKALVIIHDDSKNFKKAATDKFNAATYSTGRAAASVTSTVMEPSAKVEAASLDDDEIIYSRVKSKGYAQILTNIGPLNLEIFCKETPQTSHNFLELCRRNYYDGTIFHRLIKNFVVQGGDPTGTGKGGDSIWGKPFKDEFNAHLVHQGRGVLSMANSGPNTNKSQFFITLKSCRHLDRKHTVFGKVVGGLETLDKIQEMETDKNDRPKQEIKIVQAKVFVDPFQEQREKLEEERKNEKATTEKLNEQVKKAPEPSTSKVGSLIDFDKIKWEDDDEDEATSEFKQPFPPKKKTKPSQGFGDFIDW